MKITIPLFPLIDLSNQFTYVIGNNGVGKSRMLEYNAKQVSYNQDVVVIASGLTDKFRFGKTVRREKRGSYTYLGNRTVGNASHITTLAANAALHFVESMRNGNAPVLKIFLEKLGFAPEVYISPRDTKKLSAKDAGFERAVLDEDFVEKFGKILQDPIKPFSMSVGKNGRDVSFVDLSSGEQNIISMALKLISQLRENIIFFIDEPEISLHLEWQLAWPGLVSDIVSSINNCRVVVATHSPVIISSAIATGAVCFNMERGAKLRIMTKDDVNVEMLMLKEFHTYTPRNKALFEEFARVLTMAIDYVNDNTHTVGAVKEELAELMLRVDSLSTSEFDGQGVLSATSEFEGAILEVLNRNRKDA